MNTASIALGLQGADNAGVAPPPARETQGRDRSPDAFAQALKQQQARPAKAAREPASRGADKPLGQATPAQQPPQDPTHATRGRAHPAQAGKADPGDAGSGRVSQPADEADDPGEGEHDATGLGAGEPAAADPAHPANPADLTQALLAALHRPAAGADAAGRAEADTAPDEGDPTGDAAGRPHALARRGETGAARGAAALAAAPGETGLPNQQNQAPAERPGLASEPGAPAAGALAPASFTPAGAAVAAHAPGAPAEPSSTSPVPVPTATIEPEVGSPGFAPALGASLAVLVRDGVQEARLALHPADMGPITVQIALDGQAANVQFQAEQPATRAALESSLPALAAALRDGGFTLAGGGVSQQGRGGAERQPGQDRPGRTATGHGAGAAVQEVAPRRTAVARGVVDLYA